MQIKKVQVFVPFLFLAYWDIIKIGVNFEQDKIQFHILLSRKRVSGMNLHQTVDQIFLNDERNSQIQAISIGFALLTRISSIPGSPSFTFAQPLINSRLFLAPWVLIGSQVFLLLAKVIFRLDKLPVYDITRGQRLQIPIGELQSLLQYLSSRKVDPLPNQGSNFYRPQSSSGPVFPTELPPDSPFYMAIYVSVDYNNELYTPSLLAYMPIISFPGLRGAIPFLILAILAVIFVRCVVPPETTGAKPAPSLNMGQNTFLNLTTEDILAILGRFGKYFTAP